MRMKKWAAMALACFGIAASPSATGQTADEMREQRLARAAAPGFHPGDMITAELAAIKEAEALARRGKLPAAQDRMFALLKDYPFSLGTHRWLVKFYEGMSDGADQAGLGGQLAERVARHRALARTIEDSILGGTACAQPGDRCKVISPVETLFVASDRLGCKKTANKKIRVDGVPYETLSCADGRQLYFDLSAYPPDWLKDAGPP
jgi:hypothetical protein